MTLFHTDERKEALEKCEELSKKIKDLIRSSINVWDNYDGKYMKIKINLNDGLPLTKTTELRNIIIAFRSVFEDSNKYSIHKFS